MTVRTALPRPADEEYGEYYRRYVALVPDGDIVTTLEEQFAGTEVLLTGVDPGLESYRYAPDKWSIREVVGHLVDTERLFVYRALSMARGDTTPLPAMDQDAWAAHTNAHARPLAELLDEWRALRRATVLFFASLDAEAGARTGVASGKPFTVRAFPWIVAGHELWHRRLLKRDYLGGEAE